MKAQAIVITKGAGVQLVPLEADLVAWMDVRGHQYEGPATGRTLRSELRGAPRFQGLCGPCWGGDEHPLRYECWTTYYEVTQ